MYNDKLVYKVVIWVFFGISLWKEKETLRLYGETMCHSSGRDRVFTVVSLEMHSMLIAQVSYSIVQPRRQWNKINVVRASVHLFVPVCYMYRYIFPLNVI